ncbi:hypothetical protein QFZ63_000150 [Streptomyces sp. B3I7]|nr:hypothetical protein [Streptomyces sp. B3I7]
MKVDIGAASMTAYRIVDGTLLPIDRIAADRPFPEAYTKSTA